MALQVYTVTLAGTTTPVQLSATRQPFHSMRIESDASNAIAYFGKAGVTTSVYAGTVLANTATITNAVTIGPFSGEYNSDIQEWWFLGTDGQKLRITLIT